MHPEDRLAPVVTEYVPPLHPLQSLASAMPTPLENVPVAHATHAPTESMPTPLE
jgi:hypothetical protein